MSTQIKMRRGTAAAWTAANPILSEGEPGFETDTGLEKIGDGVTKWAALLYTTDVTRLSGSGAAVLKPTAEHTGLTVIAPANAYGHYGLALDDRTVSGGGGIANASPLLRVEHEGSSNAVDILNHPNATNLALAVHNYQNTAPAMQVDQIRTTPILKLVNSQNSGEEPGVHGTGNFLELLGPYTFDTTSATGVVTSTEILTDTAKPAAFVAEDVGKSILVGAVSTTIAEVISATQIKTVSKALVNNSGVTYKYAKVAGQMFQIGPELTAQNLSTTPFTFLSSAGATVALQVQQPGGTAIALSILNNSTGNGLKVKQQAAAAEAVLIETTSAVTNNWALRVNGYQLGARIYTLDKTGPVLELEHNGTESGTCLKILNKGTGLSLDVRNATVSVFQVNKEGGFGAFGVAPPATQHVAITSPAAELAALKTAVDILREVVKEYGLTA